MNNNQIENNDKISDKILVDAINVYRNLGGTPFDDVIFELLKELRQYRKDEENGNLVRLPCKIGSSLWYIDNVNEPPLECVVTDINIKSHYVLFLTQPKKYCETLGFSKDKLGVDWWLTKEEAEQTRLELLQDSKDL